MDITLTDLLLALLENTCVVAVFAYLLVHSKYFKGVIEHRLNFMNMSVLILAFGLISVLGTMLGITVSAGAIANVRDVGPMIAGLVGGPVVGLGAGLIGGLHRYSMGGITGFTSGTATIIAGILGGVVYYLNRRRYIGALGSVAFVIIAVGINLGLGLAFAQPHDQAASVIAQVALPMVVANGVGAFVFAYIIDNMLWEKRVSKERDDFHGELERKKTELNIARDIQQSFLPENVPTLKGLEIAAACIPANEIGGDFYDFIPIDSDRTGIAIADVSGKSVSGALFMALSRADLRANVRSCAGAAGAIALTNDLIAQDSKSGMFVTLFYGVLDTGARTLTYVNAGHNPPVVLDEKSGTLGMLARTGVALGAMEGTAYEERTMPLTSGTVIVLYTDGVTEANRNDGELFGEERLNNIVRTSAGQTAGQVLERIKAGTLKFCDGAPQADDITLMVVKVL
ncbi:MAG TPA: SpoIIE family protein phosphatase [Methanocella sp.]|jgi:sigma-B regulation protein RsbU (phosphoserine phosphatase)